MGHPYLTKEACNKWDLIPRGPLCEEVEVHYTLLVDALDFDN
jgi:hypothetical protein